MEKNIVMVLAEGYEETEVVVPYDVLTRLGFTVILAHVKEPDARSAHGLVIKTHQAIDKISPESVRMLILPGGMPGSENLKNSTPVIKLVGDVYDKGGCVAAICAAPIVLAEAGVLTGKKVTCYPGFEKQLTGATYTNVPAITDGNVITGKGPGAAFDFAIELAKKLGKGAEVKELMKRMMVK